MAIRLDANSDVASASDTSAFGFQGSSVLRVIFRINTTPTNTTNRLCSKDLAGVAATRGWGIRLHDGANPVFQLQWWRGGGNIGSTADNVTPTTGQWYSCLLVFDDGKGSGEKIDWYMDATRLLASGSPVGAGIDGAPQSNTTAFSFGKDNGNGGVANNGSLVDIAEFEWMDGAIAAEDIATVASQLYNGGNFRRLRDLGYDTAVTSYHDWFTQDTTGP